MFYQSPHFSRRSDGSVVTWGRCHGTTAADILRDNGGTVLAAVRLKASARAFAAVLQSGAVRCWGDPELGGDCSQVKATGIFTDGSGIFWSRM